MNLTEWLAAITLGSTLLWNLVDRLGKGNADAYSRSEAERDRQSKEITDLNKRLDQLEGELHDLKTEVQALKFDRRVLLEFLRDIVSGRFEFDWVRGRAQDLLTRHATPDKEDT